MDKITKYQQTIIDLLNEYAQLGNSSEGLSRQVIVDKDRNHFQLVTVGWRGGKHFVYIVAFHFDIIDGKVWIQQNNTEAQIADELVERGIPKTDIVIGFQPPKVREFSGFAAA
jgi:hypothetical protein